MIIGGMSINEGMAEWAAFWKSIDGDKILDELNRWARGSLMLTAGVFAGRFFFRGHQRLT